MIDIPDNHCALPCLRSEPRLSSELPVMLPNLADLMPTIHRLSVIGGYETRFLVAEEGFQQM